MYRTTVYFCGLICFTDQLRAVLAIQLHMGDCPVYFDEPCDPKSVKFTLSTQDASGTKFYHLNPFKPKLPRSFNVLVPLKIVVHGYGGLAVDTATTNVSRAYQDVGYNVILVDWQPLSGIPCYVTAYLNTWHVGQCLSILAVSLLSLGISPSFTHVIGFSLGAHVAGFAGSHLIQTLGFSFGRITGLDPALPFFATFKNDWKLDASDAHFVDVIHTSAGTFGKLEATGHVDFYVNGGSLQPFCDNAKFTPLCSHIMAGLYFAESIRSRSGVFIGIKCDNMASYWLGMCNFGRAALMGERINSTVRGIYYVKTSSKPPFALNYFF